MTEATPTTKWRPILMRIVENARIKSRDLVSESDGQGSRLKLWGSQQRFIDMLSEGMDQGIRVFLCLKSRQLGITTISLIIDVAWLAMHPGITGALVVHNGGAKEKMRQQIQDIVASFPPRFFGSAFAIKKGRNNRDLMEFSNGSRIDFIVAGEKDAEKETFGDGSGYALVHLCAAPGTPVIVEDGRVVPIEEVKVGTKVLTHTGASATVIDAFGQPNDKGPMRRIRPWLGDAVTVSMDHSMPTQRGIVKASELKKDDLLILPVRKITSERGGDILPCDDLVATKNVTHQGWVRRESAGAGMPVEFTEEFGFAIGYYLAEGYLVRGYDSGRPRGIIFTRHRDEGGYSARAIAALTPYITKNRKTDDRKASLTAQDTIYGSPLARWVEENFGSVDQKRIPDCVFEWGEDFCKGLLAGILCGDGSKGVPKSQGRDGEYRYPSNYVVLPTTRSSLAMQSRDLAAALGYGWGAVQFYEGGIKSGRNCKPSWRIRWSGKAAAALRELMGLPVMPMKTNHIQKYEIKDGLVYLKIRAIEDGVEVPEMWDLSVDHDDHTFRTPSMAIGNTEVALYASVKALASFEQTFSTQYPNRLILYESRAAGFNHWKDMWLNAGRDYMTIKRIFIGWWAREDQIIPRTDRRFPAYGTIPPNGEESQLMNSVYHLYHHTITPEQLAWYRHRASDDKMTTEIMHAQQPWDETQAFVAGGYSFFSSKQITDAIVDMHANPDFYVYRAFRYIIGNDFFATYIEELDERTPKEQRQLRVWESPARGAQYVIGVDPAFGRNDNKDRHAISVWRCYADCMVQVAEFADNSVITEHAGWVLCHLAGVYEDCIINVELSGGPGHLIMQALDHVRQLLSSELYADQVREKKLEEFLVAARWYLYRRPDSMGAGYVYNSMTTGSSKLPMMESFRAAHRGGHLIIRSEPMLREMMDMRQEGIRVEAPGNNKDDRVIAAALANVAWKQWRQPGLIAMGSTREAVERLEEGGAPTYGDVANVIVRKYLEMREMREEDLPRAPQWLIERGLA